MLFRRRWKLAPVSVLQAEPPEQDQVSALRAGPPDWGLVFVLQVWLPEQVSVPRAGPLEDQDLVSSPQAGLPEQGQASDLHV